MNLNRLILILIFILSFSIPSIAQYSSNQLNNSIEDWLYVGGTGLGNYSTIQSAVDAADSGDTIYVYDDSSPYNESLRLDKSLHLIGENKNTTFIDSPYQMIIKSTNCNNILIKGFTLLNHYQDNYTFGVYLLLTKNITLTETIIIGCYQGIEVEASSNCTITNNKIQDGYIGINIYRVSSSTIYGNQLINNNYGIKLNDAGYTNITDNIFSNNGLYLVHDEQKCSISGNTVNNKDLLYLENIHDNVLDNVSIGQLYLSRCTNITVKNITISNASIGIEIINSNECIITKSNIHSNFDAGIMFIEKCKNNTISYNNIRNNSYGIVIKSVHYTFFEYNSIIDNILLFNDKGIYLLGLKTTIKNNSIMNNNNGIEIRGSKNVLTNNQIAKCNIIGLSLFDASSCLIHSNNFIDNQKHAGFKIFSRKGNHFQNNYWDNSVIIGPKIIPGMRHIQFFVDYWGNPLYLSIPWIQFDWHPAQEPYNITF